MLLAKDIEHFEIQSRFDKPHAQQRVESVELTQFSQLKCGARSARDLSRDDDEFTLYGC